MRDFEFSRNISYKRQNYGLINETIFEKYNEFGRDINFWDFLETRFQQRDKRSRIAAM